MSVGLAIALGGLLALAIWGAMLFRRGKAPESSAQASSHSESGAAQTDLGVDGSD